MPNKIFNQIIKLLSKKKILKKEKILFLGLAYKKNIGDPRNSASLDIFKFFKQNNYNVDYNDNFIKNIYIKNNLYRSKNLNSLKKYKAVILATDHDYYKNLNFKNTQIIFDLRNFFEKENENIIKL